jgi:PEP-CTERM motif
MVVANPLQGQRKGKLMRRVLIAALATAGLGLAAAPAQASGTLTYCSSGSSCLSGGTTVIIDTQQTNVASVGATVGGTPGSPALTFTSLQGNINGDASGQATITSAVDDILSQLTFTLATDTFTGAIFDLDNVGNGGPIDLILYTDNGDSDTYHLSTSAGTNWFYILADAGTTYTSGSFTTASTANGTDFNGGFDSFKQLRLQLGSAAAVPEPATWAMMLLGFGGIGFAMRRGRKQNGRLLQVA